VGVHAGHRSAPLVIAALAGLVHDRQSAADYEHNHLIITASKGEFIATSLASRASSAPGPIVAWTYASRFKWWRILGQALAFECV
jgi:hypothetical protein